jgi:hypothetical protein
MFTFVPKTASVVDFVEFWAPQYPVELDKKSYLAVIEKRPLTLANLNVLFDWKAGQFKKIAQKLIDEEYASRLDEINQLDPDHDPAEFIKTYGKTGAIWSIFLLHCWQPARYPIYDQNVHRAMRFVTSAKNQDFHKWKDQDKIGSYIHTYLPFYEQFRPHGIRDADRALFMCGKFLKTSKFPNIVQWREDIDPKTGLRKKKEA